MNTPDLFHYHEALHTSHVLICTWEEHVVNSFAVSNDPKLKELAKKATSVMTDLYQAIGAVTL